MPNSPSESLERLVRVIAQRHLTRVRDLAHGPPQHRATRRRLLHGRECGGDVRPGLGRHAVNARLDVTGADDLAGDHIDKIEHAVDALHLLAGE